MRWKQLGRSIAEGAGGLARAFASLVVWCIIGTFVVISLVSILWKLEDSPVQQLEGAAASLPSVFFIDMLGMEFRQLPRNEDASSFSTGNVTQFLTRLTTGIDPGDPRTLAAQTLPGAPNNQYVILVRGKNTAAHDYPLEIPPSPDLMGSHSPEEGQPEETGQQPGAGGQEPAGGESGEQEPSAPPPQEPGEPPNGADLSKKILFVYHSHNTESYLPELDGETQPDRAYSTKEKPTSITNVGKYLVDKLAEKGIGGLHSDAQYPWKTAYTESRKTVKAVMQKNEGLQFILDLHRDSARRDATTLTKDGTSYAKLYFVIGEKNPNFEQNFAFAGEMNSRVEEKLPGISRGIVKKLEHSNAEFNQSLSPYSVLIEVGGVDNTLEECYRSMDVLAEAIAEMYWDNQDTEKADTPPAPSEANSRTTAGG
ncbi:stage II sporulation protein P [Paenibacillus thermotolerans]|uniref:stage II sporulation protein P n=1 Tax=Paenibacillus thermotolerans TaxID=3027807 RepID=UPI0023680A1F|nr:MULTISPECIES: stage II sporulation protein P [unclassified Paenibacillus]